MCVYTYFLGTANSESLLDAVASCVESEESSKIAEVGLDVDSLMNNPEVLSSVLDNNVDELPPAKRVKSSNE